ncbi:hypothetical protein QQS21_012894 [Conoideocrella luteorostrata]|uniref:TPX2 C-terminal domain-containing protein n=1 Tax=Conoideocrella luteorostrata TaxID=1105319 RepID=A0AAJ0CD63_9HYPO|nr:hypothetical protein QQS21_012894 [Conoideocrella luteorostrata]
MARAMADSSAQPQVGQSFDIFDEESTLLSDKHPPTPVTSNVDVLRELSESQNQTQATSIDSSASTSASPFTKPTQKGATVSENKSAKCQPFRRSSRLQRPKADTETFEPLVAVPEESSGAVEVENAVAAAVSPSATAGKDQATKANLEDDILPQAVELKSALEEQVKKHLAGQFEWIMAYPAEAASAEAEGSEDEQILGRPSAAGFYGCNLLPARRRHTSLTATEYSTDVYALLATPLTKVSHYSSSMTTVKGVDSPASGPLSKEAAPPPPPPPPPPYPGSPLKVPGVSAMMKHATSPSLTVVSETSSSMVDGSPRTCSFSIPRIEDSLEELDKLEEELEAVHQVTRTRQFAPATAHDKPIQTSLGTSNTKPSAPAISERVSIAGYSATVRVKPSQEKRPSLRRSASLTLRDKRSSQQDHMTESPKAAAGTSRSQLAINRLSTPKHPVKSVKPPTIPKFELPGDAVARRLKEQREARQAQQAEALKAQAPPPPKPRSNKPLAKPTFELPGEAISRRKREEREAKLREEEEEARKRREFKARPIRHSMGQAAIPRETLTSRGRQSKPCPEANGSGESGLQRKRMSMGVVRNSIGRCSMSNSPRSRGRSSVIFSTEASSATSTSTGSLSGKRNSVSLEELAVQKLRGKEILSKDSSYAEDKKKGKQEREMTAKMAREDAAERSRIASREWAEKKRRKELALKQAKENQDVQKGMTA